MSAKKKKFLELLLKNKQTKIKAKQNKMLVFTFASRASRQVDDKMTEYVVLNLLQIRSNLRL